MDFKDILFHLGAYIFCASIFTFVFQGPVLQFTIGWLVGTVIGLSFLKLSKSE